MIDFTALLQSLLDLFTQLFAVFNIAGWLL